MPITVTMTSKMARHAPTSRARVIFTSHFCPMNQKSSPTRQLKTQTTVNTLASTVFSFVERQIQNWRTSTPLCSLTGKPEVGSCGVYRCHGGDSSQSDRWRNSYSLKCPAAIHMCNLLGTAVTTRTHQPADL